MKGPRELKNYFARHRKALKACNYDDLVLFKLEQCKKFRKKNRRPRDGSFSTHANFESTI